MALGIKSRKVIQEGIDNLTPFTLTNVKGRWYDSWADVPKGQADSINRPPTNPEAKGRVYVIHSYNTPIAWKLEAKGFDWWEVPNVTYSQTTTQHQSIVSVATINPGFYLQF